MQSEKEPRSSQFLLTRGTAQRVKNKGRQISSNLPDQPQCELAKARIVPLHVCLRQHEIRSRITVRRTSLILGALVWSAAPGPRGMENGIPPPTTLEIASLNEECPLCLSSEGQWTGRPFLINTPLRHKTQATENSPPWCRPIEFHSLRQWCRLSQ